jgi:hypothetical protein
LHEPDTAARVDAASSLCASDGEGAASIIVPAIAAASAMAVLCSDIISTLHLCSLKESSAERDTTESSGSLARLYHGAYQR